MWLFTPEGFYSAVAHNTKRDTIIVRTRDRGDIARLAKRFPRHKLVIGGGTDYAYRIELSRKEWSKYVAKSARDIRYPNFKDEVTRVQGRWRHELYLRVWSVMYEAFQPRARSVMHLAPDQRLDDDALERLPGRSECCVGKIVVVSGVARCVECGESPFVPDPWNAA